MTQQTKLEKDGRITHKLQAKIVLTEIILMREALAKAENEHGCDKPIDAFAKGVNYDKHMDEINMHADYLENMGVRVYGNKGRSWNREACLTGLDHIKPVCNPRLAFNACNVFHIGCSECLNTLWRMAEPDARQREITFARMRERLPELELD